VSATDVRCIARVLALALATGQVLAQNPPAVTEADIERARRETPTVTEQDIEAARRKYALPTLPSEAELRAAAVPSRPDIDALPQPATRTPIDLEALARGNALQTEGLNGTDLRSGPALLVFISLSMPEPTLQRLLDQAARARATVLIRGLINGSLRDTVARVQALIGGRQVAVQIDPRAFDRYAVTRVPSFVLARDGAHAAACASGRCAPSESYLSASGDVSLDYALEHMQRSAPGFGPDAAVFLRRLKG
jgi:conjugal transfer pilus assembly protein TrbC